MKIKEIYHVDDIIAYSGLRDCFKNRTFLVINETMHELRLYGKNKDYARGRRSLDNRKLKHVQIQTYLQVIDVTQDVYNFLKKEFPGYKHTELTVHETYV